MTSLPLLRDEAIVAARGPRNPVDQRRPYAHVVEREPDARGVVRDVATIFITNRECPFKCLMCDLWKNTTEDSVPPGAITEQIAWALDQMPGASAVKLYNAGSFFDRGAISPEEHDAIADLVRGHDEVIIECHPRLVGPGCLEFARAIAPARLQVAMGLETVDPLVLSRLNKRMTLDDFDRATRQLIEHDIGVRAFILLRPPGHDEAQGLAWTCRSLDHAAQLGVECSAVIPVRAGNGIMERLQHDGLFTPPSLASLEAAFDHGLSLQAGCVLVDLWDIEQFFDCPRCGPDRSTRLARMNLEQVVLPAVPCSCRTMSA